MASKPVMCNSASEMALLDGGVLTNSLALLPMDGNVNHDSPPPPLEKPQSEGGIHVTYAVIIVCIDSKQTRVLDQTRM